MVFFAYMALILASVTHLDGMSKSADQILARTYLVSLDASKPVRPIDQLLWTACTENKLADASGVIDLGASPRIASLDSNKNHVTPTMVSIAKRNHPLFLLLLEKGGTDFPVKLAALALESNCRVMCLLLSQYVKMSELATPDMQAIRSLHTRMFTMHPRTAQHFLVEGLSTHDVDLFAAIEQGHDALAHHLLNPNPIFSSEAIPYGRIEAIDADGMTPLICAAANGRTAIAMKLLEWRARINQCNTAGASALWYACYLKNTHLALELLKRGAHPIVAAQVAVKVDKRIFKEDELWSPLLFAAVYADISLLTELLENKEVRQKIVCFMLSTKENALHLAVQSSSPAGKDCVALLANIPALHSKDTNGKTPLHLACEQNREDLILTLVSQGGDPNMLDNAGKSPLHLLVEKNSRDMVSTVLNSSLIPICEQNRKKAVQCAGENTAIAKLLEAHTQNNSNPIELANL